MPILLFSVKPAAAISSDLVAAVVMRPVGASVHLRKGTVNRSLVGWMVLGSVPMVFLGAYLLYLLEGSRVPSRTSRRRSARRCCWPAALPGLRTSAHGRARASWATRRPPTSGRAPRFSSSATAPASPTPHAPASGRAATVSGLTTGLLTAVKKQSSPLVP